MDKKGLDRGKRMLSGFKKAAKIGAIAVGVGLAAIGVKAVKAAADMEMMATQFEVMLGSTEKANDMMEKLKKFSAATPFQIKDLAMGTQNLLAFGVSENVVIDRMRMLGDTAKGNSEMLKGLVLAYGKVQVKGKASMEELNMIAEKGIPIYEVLMKQIGVGSREAFFKMISAGKIGKEEITKAFQSMTSEGGQFHKGMEKASLTLTGLISTMKDNFNLLLADLGEQLMPVIKEMVGALTELAKGPLAELIKGLGGVLAPVITGLSGILKKVFVFLVPILEMVGDIVGKLLVGLLPILDLLEPILIIIMELTPLLEAVVELIIILVPLIVFILKIAIKLLNVILRPILKFLTKIIRLISKIVKFILGGISKIGRAFKSMLNPIKRVISKIGDFFKDMWNNIAINVNKAIEAFNKLSPGKFDIKARLPMITGAGAAMRDASQGKGGRPNVNANMQNQINVKVAGGAGGASPEAIGAAVANALQSRFALDLKKVLISAV